MSANAATRLLQHYVDNFRRLPWRSPPGSPPPEPYRVWLSEIMLQQTTVAAVVPRFTRVVERWPTVEALAAAPEEEVLHEWAGLGYYARARNLVACAREVARRGGFPQTEAGLRQLPGIGPYTAAAIAAIAFGAKATPIDTNVERVVARLEALEGKAAIRAAAGIMTPPGCAGDFAQAMMDLGASICRPKEPLCGQCPLAADCQAFRQGSPDAYPARKVRKARPQKHGIAWWIEEPEGTTRGRVQSFHHRVSPTKGVQASNVVAPAARIVAARAVIPVPAAFISYRSGFTIFKESSTGGENADRFINELRRVALPDSETTGCLNASGSVQLNLQELDDPRNRIIVTIRLVRGYGHFHRAGCGPQPAPTLALQKFFTRRNPQ